MCGPHAAAAVTAIARALLNVCCCPRGVIHAMMSWRFVGYDFDLLEKTHASVIRPRHAGVHTEWTDVLAYQSWSCEEGK